MLTAIVAILIFLIVIMIHELGHFMVAKMVGIKVNEFSIGMGPKILQKQGEETVYTIRLFPLGGYVAMEGEDEDSEDPRGFSNASAGERFAVISAGAIMNFILAIVVLSIFSYSVGEPTNIIGEIIDDSPAIESGLVAGDTIVNINGDEIKTWYDLEDSMGKTELGEDIDFEIKDKDGVNKEITIRPEVDEDRNIIGIMPEYKKSLTFAIKGGFMQTGNMLKEMFNFIASIFKGNFNSDDVGGPVAIVSVIGDATKIGYEAVLLLIGLISVNLGFLNLLPIPALDGGRLFFILIEIIRGKPMDEEIEGMIHLIGFALLMSFILFITFKDIQKINIFGG